MLIFKPDSESEKKYIREVFQMPDKKVLILWSFTQLWYPVYRMDGPV